MGHVETVMSLYAAAQRRDVEAIAALLADDITWNHHPAVTSAQAAGVAIDAARTGKAEALGFFAELARTDLHKLDPVSVLKNDSQVAVIIEMDISVKATGVRYQDTEVHLWTLREDGKIVAHRFFNDTAKVIRAHLAEDPG
jgi:ketosteroid isomerase-like protein